MIRERATTERIEVRSRSREIAFAVATGVSGERWLLGFALLLSMAGAASPPSVLAADTGTILAFGTVSSAPKGQVMVPLFVTPVPPETQVGSISAAIRVEGKGVSFLRAEKSFQLDGVNGAFQAEAKNDPSRPGQFVIQLEIATQGESRKPLRAGLVLSLVFRVEPDAPPDTKVSLVFDKLSAATIDNPPKAIEPLVSQAGFIEIVKPEAAPYVACFFFTH